MKLSKTFQYRNVWLGISMILIALFHSGFSFSSGLFRFIKEIGYCGVEICLFASGIGCYYSLEKDADPLRFLKRRAKRLYPVYLCFILAWLVYKTLVGSVSLSVVIGNLLGVQSLISWEHHFNWYISCLLVFYILAPYMKQITDACKRGLADLSVLLIFILFGVPFWNYNHFIVIAARLPIFYLGMVYAKHAVAGRSIGKRGWVMHSLSALAGSITLFLFIRFCPEKISSHGLCWYPFLLIAPGMCMLFSLLASVFENHAATKWINRLLSTIGIYSFEVYLVHDFLYETLMIPISRRLSAIPNNLLWLCTIPVVCLGVFLLNRVAKLLQSFLTHISAKHES